MKNKDAIYLNRLRKDLKEISKRIDIILFSLFNDAIEKCKHYRYDDSAFETYCAVNQEMESAETCLECDKFEEALKGK